VDPRRPTPARSLSAAVSAGVTAGGTAVKRSKETLAALQGLYDKVAVRTGRIVDRHALIHTIQTMSPGRSTAELWEETLLDLRDLHLFIHGAFADAVVRMPSAPARATSLPLVGAGAAASSATLLAKRKLLGEGSSTKKPPAASSSGDPPASASRGQVKLGTPAKSSPSSQTPRSSGKRPLGERRQRTPPPVLDLDAEEGKADARPSPAQAQGCPGPGKAGGSCGKTVSKLCRASPRLCGTCCAGGCVFHSSPRQRPSASPKPGAAPPWSGRRKPPSLGAETKGSPHKLGTASAASPAVTPKPQKGTPHTAFAPAQAKGGKAKGGKAKATQQSSPGPGSPAQSAKRRKTDAPSGASSSPAGPATRARGRKSEPSSKAAGGKGRSGR
jgi:hypothetical protein